MKVKFKKGDGRFTYGGGEPITDYFEVQNPGGVILGRIFYAYWQDRYVFAPGDNPHFTKRDLRRIADFCALQDAKERER